MVPDVAFTDPSFWGENQKDYNITRSDFAFDFVNYKGDFLDNVLYWIKEQERNGNLSKLDSRLHVGRSSGIQYSYRCGSGQETLYLGSPRGDKMVRIYDKLLEQTDNGVFKHGRDPRFDKEESINSWFRIELQSRRKCATQYLYGCYGDISTVLRCIFDDYLIRDNDGVPLPCMVDLYQWESLPEIHKISDFIQSRTTVIERSHSYITGQAFRSCVLYLLRHGVSSFIDELNLCIMKCSTSLTSADSRRFLAFRNNLARMCLEEGLTVDKLPGRMKNDSDMYFIEGGLLSSAELSKKVRENF